MPAPTRVLELRSVRGTGGGPEKTILLGTARTDPSRYAITVCYIRDLRDGIFAIDARASEARVDYVEVRERHSFDATIWPALRRLVRNRGIDIVHSHDYKTNLCAWLLARTDGIIPLATLHGYTGNSWKERLYYAADKRLVARFPKVITVSGDLKREIVSRGARTERVITVLNGIDDRVFYHNPALRGPARAALGLSADDLTIGAVGRLERQKRFDLLMEAFAELQRRHPDRRLRLVIAGDGSLRAQLEALRDRLGLGAACLLTGHRTDVARLHHAFDLFVQSSEYEGTPNAVLEAMAFETPLVATDVGGTSELAADGVHGLIVPPLNLEALISAIERVINNPDAARQRSIAARQRIETQLSFHGRMAAVERIYDSLMAEHGRDPLASPHVQGAP